LQNKLVSIGLMYRMRTRHGTKLYTMRETSKAMLRDRDLLNTATAFIADQTPSPERAYWMTFLNQDTPVFQGTEGLGAETGLAGDVHQHHAPRSVVTTAWSMETLVADPTPHTGR
jgi:lauroyl/myristoyl acyltransferase